MNEFIEEVTNEVVAGAKKANLSPQDTKFLLKNLPRFLDAGVGVGYDYDASFGWDAIDFKKSDKIQVTLKGFVCTDDENGDEPYSEPKDYTFLFFNDKDLFVKAEVGSKISGRPMDLFIDFVL